MSQKRKRQEDTDVAGVPAPKKQATEDPSGISAAERRQKRSERKSKKAQISRTDGAGNEKKKKDKEDSKDKPKTKSAPVPQSTTSPGLEQADGNLDDKIAGGQDFVPLTESVKPNATAASSLSSAAKKAKRASPRSERKKAKAVESSPSAATANTETEATDPADASKAPANTRFIVFVGNLPFSTTTEQISSHFHKLNPTSIRHPLDKEKGRSKGYAFLEFDNYSSMKTCLKVYHHSMFDPERTAKLPAEAFDENGLEIERPGGQDNKRGSGRRINVELTAGGGGKSEGRKEKIRVKNTRLEEQRDRRREAEKKAENAKRKKRGGVSDANAVEVKQKEEDGRGDIHPSRLKRVQA